MSVVVTGIGVVSPLGCSREELTRRFSAGETAASSAETGIEVSSIPLHAIAEDKRSRIGRLDRICRLFLSATYLACSDAALHLDQPLGERAGLSFGTGLGCLLTDEEYNRKIVEQGIGAASPRLFAYTVSSAAAGEVSIALGITGPNATAHVGLAAGLGAVGLGFDWIRSGKADLVIAGGADAIGPALVEALAEMGLRKDTDRARPFRDSIPGLCPAEGAVVVVLESDAHAAARGAPRLARIDGYGAGFEPTLTRASAATDGLCAAMRAALADGGRDPAEVGLIASSAHGTSLDEIERRAFLEVLGAPNDAVVVAPKQALGDAFGASGVEALALAAGFLATPPVLAPGVALDLSGDPFPKGEAERRLRGRSVAMVNALCYSGAVVTLLLSRES